MNRPKAHTRLSRRRGSATVAVLLIGTILTLVVIAYMRTSIGEMTRANRSFAQLSLITEVENILEQAIHNLNSGDWSGWTGKSPYRFKQFVRKTGSGPAISVIAVGDFSGQEQITLHLRAESREATGPVISREFTIQLTRTSPFEFGLHLQEIDLNGNNIELSSFDSGRGSYHFTDNRFDDIAVAIAADSSRRIDLGNAAIFGWLLTPGIPPTLGPQSTIRSQETPVHIRVDPARMLLDLPPDFPEPLSLETPPADASSLPPFSGRQLTLGASDSQVPAIHHAHNFDLQTNQTVQVAGPTDLYLSGQSRIRGKIVVAPTARLRLFLSGDLRISGQGAIGGDQGTAQLILYGLGGCTSIDLSGQAIFRGSIFAPAASLTLSGGGQTGVFEGAAIAASLTINGNYDFRYDRTLHRAPIPPFRYRVTSWTEPTANDSRFNFSPFL